MSVGLKVASTRERTDVSSGQSDESLARRSVVKYLGIATGAALLGRPCRSGTISVNSLDEAYVPKNLRRDEHAMLIALMSRLIPGDSESGGAVEAHADRYVDRALGDEYASLLPLYRAALATMSRYFVERGHGSVDGVSPADVDAFIERLEHDEIAFDEAGSRDGGHSSELSGKTFLAALLRQTVEGTLGDPMYGGNHGFLGWRLIGYSGVQFYYSEQEQAIDGKGGARNRSAADFGANPIK